MNSILSYFLPVSSISSGMRDIKASHNNSRLLLSVLSVFDSHYLMSPFISNKFPFSDVFYVYNSNSYSKLLFISVSLIYILLTFNLSDSLYLKGDFLQNMWIGSCLQHFNGRGFRTRKLPEIKRDISK